jgi:hypothetical protein
MARLEAGSVFAGHRIEGLVGRGGMGVVYRATDLALDRVVALKAIAPELAEDAGFRARFQLESRIAASISHPNVITIFHAGEDAGELFITMQYIEGSDLGGLIVRNGTLDERLAGRIFGQVASALAAAHDRGLVHRDVKPGNVLLAGEDSRTHAFLTDFGLTKRLSARSGMTATGVLVGTIDYIAPEQVEGRRLDARTDVYALGCVLFHALAGRIPYPRDTDMAKLYAHTMSEPPSLREAMPGVSAQLEAVVRRAMAKRPDDRFQTADELGVAILEATKQDHDIRSPSAAAATLPTAEAAPTAPAAPAPEAAPAPTAAPSGRGPSVLPPGAASAARDPAAAEPRHDAGRRAPARPRAGNRGAWALVLAVTVLAAVGVGLVASRGGAPPGPSGTASPSRAATTDTPKPFAARSFTATYPAGWTIVQNDTSVDGARRSAFWSPDRSAGITIDRTAGVSGTPSDFAAQVERNLGQSASGYRQIRSDSLTLAGRPATELVFATDGTRSPARGAAYVFFAGDAVYVVTSTGKVDADVRRRGEDVAASVRPRG